MTQAHSRRRAFRITLIAVLIVAVLALIGAIAVAVPILMHRSAGGSGQELPEDFVSDARATGEDGRERELRVETTDGEPADLSSVRAGDQLVVRGSGFNAGIGIYIGICAIPDTAGAKPSPCLGAIPEGAEEGEAQGETGLASVWITDDWAWRAFATQQYDDAETGSFSALLTVPGPSSNGLNCAEDRCAVTTRADHTAASDRVQDMQLPLAFAE